jgi:hypothetical protein
VRVAARLVVPLAVAAVMAAGAAGPTVAGAEPRLHECQKPVVTGVEVYALRGGVGTAQACRLALALFSWENTDDHAAALYGCRRPHPNGVGYPYLRLRRFHRWKLSLTGRPYGAFTMSRGRRSFEVTGTDFPLNCS